VSLDGEAIDGAGIERLLRHTLGIDARKIERVGAGAWSQCFGFAEPTGEYVIRVGRFVDDFERDRVAHRYCSRDLPIPEVTAIGQAFGGHYAISTRAPGTPLELCAPREWPPLVPAVVRVLAALREAEPVGDGFGIWDHTGTAAHSTWRSFLMEIADDEPHHRIHGWSQKLRRSEGGGARFARFLHVLDEVAVDDVPRSIIHSDLINRNVHVQSSRVTGVFDWGCSAYGDHLFDLAWFEFWSPWHPNLDLVPLRATIADALGAQVEQRFLACLLYIGLAHIVYNAHLDNWPEVANVERRLAEVHGQFG
jgi:hygromycin-B 4-O-kinase